MEEARCKPRVVFADRAPAFTESALGRLCGFGTVALDDGAGEEELVAEVGTAWAVVSGLRPVGRRALADARELRLLVSSGAGYDHFDVGAATERGIYVANAPGANAISVAEIAIGLMFAVARCLCQSYRMVREGLWVDDDFRRRILGVELTGGTAGIIGMGHVGTELARRLRLLGMNVLSCTRRPSREREERLGVRFVSLEELLSESDFVVVCCALTPQTRGLIGRRELGLMKPDAYLVNVARGAIVDEEALCEALSSRRIAGAGMDVLAVEPPGPNHPLFPLDNAVVVSHLGSRTRQAIERISQMVVDEIIRVRAGDAPAHLVNPQVLDSSGL